ncbi:tumor necrosis factor receptor superfamily member 4 [Thamnophis elegans]|uniref:tumor necrosis factor receptor superfamily member 4 n=1 Tax=Thamnophis elegans TaxID=35005 RepID=UPI0013772EDC|nr:tumor necrosis factor receptor superfamily member 4 [Thamnophis elegans]
MAVPQPTSQGCLEDDTEKETELPGRGPVVWGGGSRKVRRSLPTSSCLLGEQLVKRCTDTSSTDCESCDENYYNDAYTYSRCKPCTECHADRGLREIRSCQRTSNTVCACLPGHAPEESRESGEEKRCKRCPRGIFPSEGTRNVVLGPSRYVVACRQINGGRILRPGKQDMDTICDMPSSKIATQRTMTQPSTFPKESTVFTSSSPVVVLQIQVNYP